MSLATNSTTVWCTSRQPSWTLGTPIEEQSEVSSREDSVQAAPPLMTTDVLVWRHQPPVTIFDFPFSRSEGEFGIPVMGCSAGGQTESAVVVYRDANALQDGVSILLSRPGIVLAGFYEVSASCELEGRFVKVDWKIHLENDEKRDKFLIYAFDALFGAGRDTVVYEEPSSLCFIQRFSLSMEETVERVKSVVSHLMRGGLSITTRPSVQDSIQVVSSREGWN